MREIKNLPDNETLDSLIEMAEEFEQKAKELYDLTTEIDDKRRVKLEKRRKLAIKSSRMKQD